MLAEGMRHSGYAVGMERERPRKQKRDAAVRPEPSGNSDEGPSSDVVAAEAERSSWLVGEPIDFELWCRASRRGDGGNQRFAVAK